MYCIDLLPFFNFYYIYVCVEDNVFLLLFHIIDFYIVILFYFKYYFPQLYYYYTPTTTTTTTPPLFNVVFFIYLYAVNSFLQQILIFFWYPSLPPKKTFSHKNKIKKTLWKKKFTNLLSCQNNFSIEMWFCHH